MKGSRKERWGIGGFPRAAAGEGGPLTSGTRQTGGQTGRDMVHTLAPVPPPALHSLDPCWPLKLVPGEEGEVGCFKGAGSGLHPACGRAPH